MSKKKKYRLNKDTLLYELHKETWHSRFFLILSLIFLSIILALIFMGVYSRVLNKDLPKTVILKKENQSWLSKIEVLNRQIDNQEELLKTLSLRDNDVYRTIFVLDKISPSIRKAELKDLTRYLDSLSPSSSLYKTANRIDDVTRQIFVQSKSLDDINLMSKTAGNMASCLPTISPLYTDRSQFRESSPFGYRIHPITGQRKMHTGFDLACRVGTPIYATGNGVVENVQRESRGYGNWVLINHGYGYETRYAHMSRIFVKPGMKILRGECIGETGNTGGSTGPHLHYEVIFKKRFVDPKLYFDLNMPVQEYKVLIDKAKSESTNNIVIPQKQDNRSKKRRRV